MILNDKPNCQVSRVLMNPRPILSDRSENDPGCVSLSGICRVLVKFQTNLLINHESQLLAQE
jgi:hypothetical protein